MGKQKQEDPPAGAPAWMATFSDLMNLLLCFFVLLFSMSTVDAEKFEIVINSFQEAFSILPSGGATLTEGVMISSGISQLPEFANYFGDTMSDGDGEDEIDAGDLDEEGQEPPGGQAEGQGKFDQEIMQEAMEELVDQIQQEKLSESEAMAEKIEALATQYGIQDMIEVDFNGQYVRITMNGALLFDSGQSDLRKEAIPLVENLSKVLNIYGENLIEVDGHTDNVPIHSAKYEDNDVLSMYRALSVANMIRHNTTLDPAHIVSAGRGEYEPVADNATSEGRARNRRVEIKIYNTFDTNQMEVEADGSTEVKQSGDTESKQSETTEPNQSETTALDNTSQEETTNEEESADNSDTGTLSGEPDTDSDNGVRSSTGGE